MHLDVALATVRELTQPQAHALRDAIQLRHQLLADLRSTLVAALVTVGAQVKVRDNLKETDLRGLVGTVQSKNGKYATVLLDEASTARLASNPGRYTGRIPEDTARHELHGMPAAALEAVDAPDGFRALVRFLVTDATSDQLATVDAARKQRIHGLAAHTGTGATVMVTNVSPKFLAGLTGTIDSVDQAEGTYRVLLDEKSTLHLRLQYSRRFPVPDSVARHPIRLKFEQAVVISGD